MKKRIVVFFLVSIAGFFFLHDRLQVFNMNAAIHACNTVTKEVRFSCYRNAIELSYRSHKSMNLAEFVKYLDTSESQASVSEDASYAIFGTSCHTFYHAVGDFIATKSQSTDIKANLALCSLTCTKGCMMGLYKRTALIHGYDDRTIQSFIAACRPNEKHQCSHEIGHILHDKYTTSILATIDGITAKVYHLMPAMAYAYTTQTNPNLNGPFEDCKRLVAPGELPYCYTGIGHNLFLFSQFSPAGYQDQFKKCDSVAPENRDACISFLIYRIGINDAAPLFLKKQFSGGNAVCADAIAKSQRPDLMKHCYVGVGGGIGLFVESEFPDYKLLDPKGRDRIKGELLGYAKLCENAAGENQTYCLKGLAGSGFRNMYISLYLQYDKMDAVLKGLADPSQETTPDVRQKQFFNINGFEVVG